MGVYMHLCERSYSINDVMYEHYEVLISFVNYNNIVSCQRFKVWEVSFKCVFVAKSLAVKLYSCKTVLLFFVSNAVIWQDVVQAGTHS